MRIVVILSLLSTTPAFAQALVPPNDQQIARAYAICNDPTNPKRIGIGSVGKRPPDAGKYRPEFQEQCELADAEHKKRGLAAKAKQDADLNELNALTGKATK